MDKYKILLVDDSNRLYLDLVDEDDLLFDIKLCYGTRCIEEPCQFEDVDIVVINYEMKLVNTIELFKRIKNIYELPIIFLSNKAESNIRIKGLKLGADAFIQLPCDVLELKLRIYKILEHLNFRNIRVIGDYEINSVTHQVKYKKQTLRLTPHPYRLLCYLLNNPNTELSREQILENVWGHSTMYGNRIVDTNINVLRKETQDGNIKSIRGVGYRYILQE